MGARGVLLGLFWTILLFLGAALTYILYTSSTLYHQNNDSFLTLSPLAPPLDVEPRKYIQDIWNSKCADAPPSTLVAVHCFYLQDRIQDIHPAPHLIRIQTAHNISLNKACSNQSIISTDLCVFATNIIINTEANLVLFLGISWLFLLLFLFVAYLYFTSSSSSSNCFTTPTHTVTFTINSSPLSTTTTPLLTDEEQAYNREIRLRKH